MITIVPSKDSTSQCNSCGATEGRFFELCVNHKNNMAQTMTLRFCFDCLAEIRSKAVRALLPHLFR